jgi:mono/diheme cytochrome c family protein
MMPTRPSAQRFWLSVLVGLSLRAAWPTPLLAADAPVDFARDIRPILAAHCAKCHGAEKQESGLRLDTAAGLTAGGNSGPGLVAGKSRQSLIVKAIRGDEEEVSKMPPEGPPLSAAEIALVARWIDEGARLPAEAATALARRTSDHWSFQPLADVEPPAVKHTAWVRNAIDRFVLSRLEAAGLEPSAAAEPATLARRVSLDLIGLPPAVGDADALAADSNGDAYERLVDRLLASPHYGERWGRHWLDVARYADSNGYTIDSGRSIWKYRDWVIAALNRDLPFDAFAIEQLAGDMLPEARADQIIATGFHRNTLVNEEGGTDDEQFRVEAVVDRVSTTGSAFLGLTLGCARCHDHKYDPISQREFYELFAIFNNADEPTLPVPTDQQAKEVPALLAEIEQAEIRLKQVDDNAAGRQGEWERRLAGKTTIQWTALDATAHSAGGARIARLDDNSLLVGGTIPLGDTYTVSAAAPPHAITAVMLETLPHESLPGKGPGLAEGGGFSLSEFAVSIETPGGPSQPVVIASARADYAVKAGPPRHAIDNKPQTGWQATDAKALGVPRTAVFTLSAPIAPSDGAKLVCTLAHDEKRERLQIGRFRISVSGADREVIDLPAPVRDALAIAPDKRSDEQKKLLREQYQRVDPERVPLAAQIAELKRRREQIERATTTTLVMRERSEPRATQVHLRGDFLRPGAAVQPDVPDVLPPLQPRGERADRLDFARWLVSRDNPLTARVTVNRVWQCYFGQGLVATENDFGLQGQRPTHPELLDWLARQFMESGWSVKALHRLIVTSATYRQSSRARGDLASADPYNRLLGRQTRLRLEAEAIRDAALTASGLLAREIGGPGVYPPQPEGVYRFTQQKKFWGESRGADRYRRGMYTYLWRSSPYPLLKTFDAPDATVACTRRPRSNTPLQALTLANDRAFVEIAQGFAANILAEPAADDASRVRLAFRRSLAREPSAEELSALSEYVVAERQRFAETPKDAAAVAPAQRPAGCDAPTAAAWTMLARVLLNLDEFITRE